MKNVLLLLLLAFLLSCQNENTPEPAAFKTPVINDSNIAKREPANPYAPVDLSPMDIAYLPSDYPIKKMNGEQTGLPVARILYSRPHRQGREIFGNIVKWGEPWRLGANEATEIRVFQPVTIQGKQIPVGQYTLYAIPYEDRWTIIFNSELYTWGLRFNTAKDIASFDIPVTTRDRMVEYFTIVFDETEKGADLVLAWANKEARLPLQF
ncbi:DUF2911 domain-containing protein [Flavisolibacter sp. BT320]|nr:DUF2911 domain-containing protein [Flavisolibacter longurius]